jgi:hypothetical protein
MALFLALLAAFATGGSWFLRHVAAPLDGSTGGMSGGPLS